MKSYAAFVGKLKPSAHSVESHLAIVKKSVSKKHQFLDGNRSEFRMSKKPRKEFEQLSKLLEDYEDKMNADLLTVLLGLEVNVHKLEKSVESEEVMVNNLTVQKSIRTGMYSYVKFAEAVEHQLNLIVDILQLSKNAFALLYSVKEKKERDVLCEILLNINSTANFIKQIILDEEFPEISIAYNSLKLKNWNTIEKRILAIKEKILGIESHIL